VRGLLGEIDRDVRNGYHHVSCAKEVKEGQVPLRDGTDLEVAADPPNKGAPLAQKRLCLLVSLLHRCALPPWQPVAVPAGVPIYPRPNPDACSPPRVDTPSAGDAVERDLDARNPRGGAAVAPLPAGLSPRT